MKKSRRLVILWCLLVLPLYQGLGTIRHEVSHAVVAWWQGATITQFVFWPSWQNGHWLWGYVRWTGGQTTWLTLAAPYLNDLILAAVSFGLLWNCRRGRRTHPWLWWNGFILGILSPLMNSGYAYVRHFFTDNDISKLYTSLPSAVIHGYFLVTILLYVIFSWRLIVKTKT